MPKSLMIIVCLLLTLSWAQVTYGNTLTQEELEQYFYGGIQVIDMTIPEVRRLHYQFIDLRTMRIVADNVHETEQSDRDEWIVEQARFLLSFSTNGDFGCGGELDINKKSTFSYNFSVTYKNPDDLEVDVTNGGGSTCVEFNNNFNVGHWTDILNDSSPLPLNQWIPVTAFIPNHHDGSLAFAPAGEWFVLLVLFDNGSYTEPPLTQAEFIARIQDYGINPNP